MSVEENVDDIDEGRPQMSELPKTIEVKASEFDSIEPTATAVSSVENTVIVANLAGMMSTTICSLIEVSDNQYVRLD